MGVRNRRADETTRDRQSVVVGRLSVVHRKGVGTKGANWLGCLEGVLERGGAAGRCLMCAIRSTGPQAVGTRPDLGLDCQDGSFGFSFLRAAQ